MRTLRSSAFAVAAGLALSFAATAALPKTASAQPLAWEEVGDAPIDPNDLAFAPDGALWVTTAVGDLYRLSPGGTVWEEVADSPGSTGDYILPLTPDTVFIATRSGIRRSTEGGGEGTFVPVYLDGGGALADTPLAGPNDGLLLSGTKDSIGVAYSLDRGTTWQHASIISNTLPLHEAQAFAELPYAHSYPGRLTTAAFAGLRYSDDGGATWVKSNIHEDFRFIADDVEVAADGRVWATAADATLPGAQRYVSSDGASWAHAGSFVVDGEPTWPTLLVAAEGGPQPAFGVLLAVTVKGRVYRSDDGGAAWAEEARVPLDVPTSFVHDALLGTDGRLYVAVVRSGTEREWVYRTAGAVVANEPGPDVAPVSFALGVPRPNPSRGGAVVPFTLAAPAQVRLAVHDALGREVAVLADGAFPAGRHEAVLDGAEAGLPSGSYLVRATVESGGAPRRSFVQRLTLLK